MKISHIIDKDKETVNAWSFYEKRDRKHIEYTSERKYVLTIYDKTNLGYRYQLESFKGNYFRNILTTDSKEKMKMTLDLMGLTIKQVNIFMMENSTGKKIVIYSLIDLMEKC